MLIQSIGYTAMLIDYISKLTHQDLADVTRSIGEAGVARLAHNAPMNRHLPIFRIANEVMHDYGITCRYPDSTMMPYETVSSLAMEQVQAVTSQKNLFATTLYHWLCGELN